MTGMADIVLTVHALLALFIVGSVPAIWMGAVLGWRWVRNRMFRFAHLLATGVVATLSLLNIACPLTVLEDRLRNGLIGPQGCLQRRVNQFLFYELPTWVFTSIYVAFALLVILTWWCIRPRRES